MVAFGNALRYGSGRSPGAYTGAGRHSDSLRLWQPNLRAVDAELLEDGPALRARARDLERNNPVATQATRASRLGVVGPKMRFSCRPDHVFLGIDEDAARGFAENFDRVWESYAHGPGFMADAGRRFTFSGLMGLAHDADFIDGEALIAVEWDEAARWNSCFQLIDVDRLSNPEGAPVTRYLKGGVELNRLGQPLAFHIRDAHPDEPGIEADAARFRHSRIPRATEWGRPVMLHAFAPHRAGQTRGRSAFAPVIEAMKMGSEYVQASVASMILQASYAAVLETEANHAAALEALGLSTDATRLDADALVEASERQAEAAMAWNEEMKLRFQGAQVPVLWPNEKLKLLTPGNNAAASLSDFSAHQHRAYAAGFGVDPIALDQDYSSVNYSSAKMAAATTHRHYESKRARLADQVALPMVRCVLEEAVMSGALDLPKGFDAADFYEPGAIEALGMGVFLCAGPPQLDPAKEAAALRERLDLGIETREEACAREGRSFRAIVAAQAREKDLMREYGLSPMEFGMTDPETEVEMEAAKADAKANAEPGADAEPSAPDPTENEAAPKE